MTEKEINKIVSENLNYVKSVANQYKEIITKFYGIGVPKETMAEIAEDMGLKRERVRQIRNLTIRRLNRSIRHQALRNYFKR